MSDQEVPVKELLVVLVPAAHVQHVAVIHSGSIVASIGMYQSQKPDVRHVHAACLAYQPLPQHR